DLVGHGTSSWGFGFWVQGLGWSSPNPKPQTLAPAQCLQNVHICVRAYWIAKPGAVGNQLVLDEDVDVLPQTAPLITDVEGKPRRDLLKFADHLRRAGRVHIQLLTLKMRKETVQMSCQRYLCHDAG